MLHRRLVLYLESVFLTVESFIQIKKATIRKQKLFFPMFRKITALLISWAL